MIRFKKIVTLVANDRINDGQLQEMILKRKRRKEWRETLWIGMITCWADEELESCTSDADMVLLFWGLVEEYEMG